VAHRKVEYRSELHKPGLCCPQIYVTFSIRLPIDSGFQLAERQIGSLELSQELQQVRIVAPTFSRLPEFGFTHAQRLRLHLQIAFRVDIRRVD
jgi:hypothetical protein